MANANATLIGQQLGAGDPRALFLKLYSGEVLTVYDAATKMKDMTRCRHITHGKSYQFPAIGRTTAAYHAAGAEINGSIIQSDEKIITIDDVLLASVFISQIDEAISQFEVRSEYAKRMGQALAQTYDRNLLSMAVLACRSTGAGGIGVGAVGQQNAVSMAIGVTPTAQNIVDAMYAAAVTYDNNFIPSEDRYAIVSPATYWSLVTNDKLLNKFFNEGNGDYAKGVVGEVAGFKIIRSPNVSLDHTLAGNLAAFPDYGTKYEVNASNTAVLLLTPEAMGTVKLMDISSEMDYDIRRQGTLMVSKMALGHGVLRPECLYELKKA